VENLADYMIYFLSSSAACCAATGQHGTPAGSRHPTPVQCDWRSRADNHVDEEWPASSESEEDTGS